MADRESDDRICIVDADPEARSALSCLVRSAGYEVRSYACPRRYLDVERFDRNACVLVDTCAQEASGVDLQHALAERGAAVRVILMAGSADVAATVRAMKAGALTVLAKPVETQAMLDAVSDAVAGARTYRARAARVRQVAQNFGALTGRERQVMALVTAGLMNKEVANRLSLCEITVKIHRGHMMRKMRAESLPDLVRMADLLGV